MTGHDQRSCGDLHDGNGVQGGYKDALDELLLAEEAFSCCAASVVDAVDNIALLKLDIVWCAAVESST